MRLSLLGLEVEDLVVGSGRNIHRMVRRVRGGNRLCGDSAGNSREERGGGGWVNCC